MLEKDKSFKNRSLDCHIVWGNIPMRPTDCPSPSLNENFWGAPDTFGELFAA